MIKLFEHKVKLTEAYDASAPDWIKTWLAYKPRANYGWRSNRTDTDKINSRSGFSLGKQYDLGNAEWHEEEVPTSPSDPRLKDANRVSFFLMPGSSRVYDPEEGKYNTVEKDTVLAYVSNPDSNGEYWEHKWIPDLNDIGFRANASLKTLLPYFTKYAWVERETNRQNAKDTRQQRRELQQGAIALERKMNDWWDRDASGYIVDKNKYKRLLVSKKANKMVQDALDAINDYLTKSRALITDFVNNVSDKYALQKLAGQYNRNYYSSALHYLDTLLDYASKCNGWLEKLQNNEDLEKSNPLLYHASEVYDITEEAKKAYESLVKAIPTIK